MRFPNKATEMETFRIVSRPSHQKILSPALRERVAGAQRRPGEGLSAGKYPHPPTPAARVPPSPAMRERGFLARFGPAFGEGEGAGAERAAFALQRPGFAGGLDAVARKPRAERRDQQGADAVFAA